MPPERTDAASLHDMRRAGELVVRYIAGKTRDVYEQDQLLRDAVERRLEIVGEAARRISQAFLDAHSEVPWRKIMATRHILAHEYDEIDNDIVWQIATVYVPEMLEKIRPLIPPPPPDPEPENSSS